MAQSLQGSAKHLDPLVDETARMARTIVPGRGLGSGPHVVSYVHLLMAADAVTRLLRLETARHVYNMEPLETPDPDQDVRTIAQSRPPMLHGLANMTLNGIGAMLSSPPPKPGQGANTDDNDTVVALIPGSLPKVPQNQAPPTEIRPVIIVARDAQNPDVCTLLRATAIAADSFTGIMTHRLAPHASHTVHDAAMSFASELIAQTLEVHGQHAETLDDAEAAHYLTPHLAIEMIARGHIAAARMTIERLRASPGPYDAKAIDWCEELVGLVSPWPNVDDENAYEAARQATAQEIQDAFFRKDPEDDHLYAAILAANRCMSLPRAFLELPRDHESADPRRVITPRWGT